MTLSPRERAAQKVKTHREQEQLFEDLLKILDALDHACAHWQHAEESHRQVSIDREPRHGSHSPESSLQLPPPPQQGQHRIRRWLGQILSRCAALVTGTAPDADPSTVPDADAASDSESMSEVLSSAHSGVEMIRRSLLEILEQRQVTPIMTVGQTFDPVQMYALGRQSSADAPDNTVIQEVVRGYRWQQRILREAQVIVASSPESPPESPE